jgi:hypothetical protein
MRALIKNWLSLNKKFCLSFINQKALTCLLVFLLANISNAQIANYVNNGGFEQCDNCNQIWYPTVATYWNATDTGKFGGIVVTSDPPTGMVPKNSNTYQWPRHGKNYLLGTEFNATCPGQSCVGYPRNRLKAFLQAGHTYCLKMYVNLANESTHAISQLGVYFADSSTDTIKYCVTPITYLTPQVQNTSGFLSDTLNWVLITGTYTAIGNEKYLMLGNYNSSASTNTLFVNPKNSPAAYSVYCYDDISVIDVNLPVFAGNDTFFVPGDSVYLGRPRDVGIDEDCTWYKLPNTTNAIDTVAGLWVKPVTTSTYVVKQDICGVIKWDTVIVYQSAIGINELDFLSNNVKLYPQPAQDILNIELGFESNKKYNKISIIDNLGQMIREEDITFTYNKAAVNIKNLANGVYFIAISNQNNESINKKLVITK